MEAELGEETPNLSLAEVVSFPGSLNREQIVSTVSLTG